MKSRRSIAIFALALLLFSLMPYNLALADSKLRCPFDSDLFRLDLKGVDAIHVSGIWPSNPKFNNAGPYPFSLDEALADGVTAAFSDQDWLRIYPKYLSPAHSPVNLDPQTTVEMEFTVYSRTETIENKVVTIASLSLRVMRLKPKGSASLDYTNTLWQGQETYPFVVTDNAKELREKIIEGAEELTGWMQGHFGGANGKPYKSYCPHHSEL